MERVPQAAMGIFRLKKEVRERPLKDVFEQPAQPFFVAGREFVSGFKEEMRGRT